MGVQGHALTCLARQFCIRACYPGGDDYKMCEHIYDTEGCECE